jgi:long-chain acyl-CoA synthetase
MFFHSAGIKILEGYGLTETGPVLSVREMDNPIFGTVGNILPDVNWKILDEQGHEVSEGKKGVLWVKSPQVMQGYYKRPEATEAVLKDGWLNTGDLVIATYEGQIKIIGREKDTIVLLGGENIEPEPIEARLLKSEYIEQAMVLGRIKNTWGPSLSPTSSFWKSLPRTTKFLTWNLRNWRKMLRSRNSSTGDPRASQCENWLQALRAGPALHDFP